VKSIASFLSSSSCFFSVFCRMNWVWTYRGTMVRWTDSRNNSQAWLECVRLRCPCLPGLDLIGYLVLKLCSYAYSDQAMRYGCSCDRCQRPECANRNWRRSLASGNQLPWGIDAKRASFYAPIRAWKHLGLPWLVLANVWRLWTQLLLHTGKKWAGASWFWCMQ